MSEAARDRAAAAARPRPRASTRRSPAPRPTPSGSKPAPPRSPPAPRRCAPAPPRLPAPVVDPDRPPAASRRPGPADRGERIGRRRIVRTQAPSEPPFRRGGPHSQRRPRHAQHHLPGRPYRDRARACSRSSDWPEAAMPECCRDPPRRPRSTDAALRSGLVMHGYVDWPAIFAGTALAVALSFVLLTFGSAIGLSVASFEPGEGASLLLARASPPGSGSSGSRSPASPPAATSPAGCAARCPAVSIDEAETRDGAHGVLVWATARARRRRARHRRRHRGRRRRRLRRRHRRRRPRPRPSAATSTISARRLLGSGGGRATPAPGRTSSR